MKLLNFLSESVKMTVSRESMYKFNFILTTITLLSFEIVLPLTTILVYVHSNGFSGWAFNEILLFLGIFMLINSLDRMFFQKVDWTLSYDVRSGNFDRYLLFPVNTLAYVSFTNFGLEQFIDFMVSIGVVVYAAFRLQLSPDFFQVLAFLWFILLAVMFMFSLAIFKFSIVLKFVNIGRVGELIRTVKSFGQYPVDIYRLGLSAVFRYIIPLALFAYYPSKALLEGINANIIYLTAVVFIIFGVSYTLWKYALRSYTSAGG
jgi:ABC-2 type transport system permease protein